MTTGKRAFSHETTVDRYAAAAGLAADPRLVMFARRIFIDIWITVFMSLTLVMFALSERYPERRRQFLLLMYVAIGLGAAGADTMADVTACPGTDTCKLGIAASRGR